MLRFETFLRLTLSAVALTSACGGQTGDNIASTSPGAGGSVSGAGGSSAGGGTAAAGKAGSTAGGGSAGSTGGGSAGTAGGSAGTAGGSAGQAGGGTAGKGGASGTGGAGGFPACCGPTAPCPGGYECVDTICVVPPASGSCYSDADCAFPNSGPWMCDGGKVCPCNADCSYDTVLGTCVMGSGGAAGAGGSGGATGACPTTFPSGGESCAPDGLQCPGGACCGPSAVCVGGKWNIVISTCPLPQPCPTAPPADGSSCCGGYPPACAWDQCASTGYVSATCDPGIGKWSVSTQGCDTGASCNGTTCKPGEICVEHQGGAGVSYTCDADPCGTSPLSCACAGSICGGPPMGCLVNDPQHLTCTCNLCP